MSNAQSAASSNNSSGNPGNNTKPAEPQIRSILENFTTKVKK